MLTVQIPGHLLYECTQYLNQNGMYVDREYAQSKTAEGHIQFSFGSKDGYLAFCYRYSKVIL